MSPIRLIIIAILLYIGYLLIKGGSGKRKRDNEDVSPEQDVADVLIEDPVCKKLVPKKQAVILDHKGEKVYFCSKECCDSFVSEKGAEK